LTKRSKETNLGLDGHPNPRGWNKTPFIAKELGKRASYEFLAGNSAKAGGNTHLDSAVASVLSWLQQRAARNELAAVS
jgi:hypothetical protein